MKDVGYRIKLILIFFVLLNVSLYAYVEYFDMMGEYIFTGDRLFEFSRYSTRNYSYTTTYAQRDRFLRDFGSEVTLYEWINNREFELKLGRIPTRFTNLTLDKTRFRWGYPGPYYKWGDEHEDWEKWYSWNKWWDQRGVRLRVSKGLEEFIFLSAKTASSSEIEDWGTNTLNSWDDYKFHRPDWRFDNSWIRDYDRWNWIPFEPEQMYDWDRYLMGFRKKFKLAGFDVGFSFVNQHYTTLYGDNNEESLLNNLTSSNGPLEGTISNQDIPEIFIGFLDDSPIQDDGSEDNNGAAIYNIKVYLDGKEVTELRVISGKPYDINYVKEYSENVNSASYTDRVEVIGSRSWLVYKFIIPPGFNRASISDLKFEFTVAKDYNIFNVMKVNRYDKLGVDIFEREEDINRQYPIKSIPGDTNHIMMFTNTIARAEGDPKSDISNKTTIEYHYGLHTGNSILGIDISGVIPKMDIALQAEYVVSKTFYKYPTQTGNRSFIDGSAYYVQASKQLFSSFFLVGKYFNINPKFDAAFAVEDNDDNDDKPDVADDVVTEITGRIDRNNNGTPDWDDDFLRFTTDEAFIYGRDDNNNGVIDFNENDAKPDYTFPPGEKGYQLQLGYSISSSLKLLTRYNNTIEILSDHKNKFYEGVLKYFLSTPIGNGDLIFESKYVQDNIRDNVISSDWSNDQQQLIEDVIDRLEYRDSIYSSLRFTFTYELVPNLKFIPKYRFIFNKQLFDNQKTIIENIGVFKVRYDGWYPFKAIDFLSKWQVLPLYKLKKINRLNIETGKMTITDDSRLDAFGLQFVNQLSDKTKLNIGQEIVYYSQTIDQDYLRIVTGAEFTHKNTYWDRPIMVQGGFKHYTQRGNETFFEYINETRIYINAYFIW